jgi:translocation protein SEC66
MWPFDTVDWLMLTVPIAYIGILASSFAVFTNLYRKRKAANAASLEPWFPTHLQRNVYLSLLHMENPKVPDSILKAALLRRATEDIHRIVQIRNAKQALQVLLQRGSVGDDLWQRFQRAEKEIEEELRDVVNEVSSNGTVSQQLVFLILTFKRPTRLHPTGARPSSSPLLKSHKTHTCASALARSHRRLLPRRSGGRRRRRAFSRIS